MRWKPVACSPPSACPTPRPSPRAGGTVPTPPPTVHQVLHDWLIASGELDVGDAVTGCAMSIGQGVVSPVDSHTFGCTRTRDRPISLRL